MTLSKYFNSEDSRDYSKWHLRNLDLFPFKYHLSISVSILIYNRDRKSLVLVKQMRPGQYNIKTIVSNASSVDNIFTLMKSLFFLSVVYYAQHQNSCNANNPPEDVGYTLEICAGLVDKPNLSLEEIAAAEVHEECGYKVDPSRLRKFSTVIVNDCLSAAIGCVYYLEVGDNDLDLAAGGGNAEDGEWIEVVYWPIDRIDELLTLTETKLHVSDTTILAALWFQLHIVPSL
ncbi:unnamed protein product [Rodentolepis nana]|uniref:Nudix hydrolase domain-containing protein n=1 Tax=Rodentolepis nana TaxID=102285 RepID=A0A0R3TXV3_RODNA|nr:unnamed protein product [Rodentolepis nana]